MCSPLLRHFITKRTERKREGEVQKKNPPLKEIERSFRGIDSNKTQKKKKINNQTHGGAAQIKQEINFKKGPLFGE